MAAGPSATSSSLRRATNLPTPLSFTIMGWCNPVGKGSGTFTNLCSLESGTASAASGVQLSWENSGSALFLMSTYPTEFKFGRYPLPGATTGQPFYFAMTGNGSGTTDLRAYWMSEGESDFQMVVAPGKSFTSGGLFLGNGSYNDWSNTRFANVKVYKAALQPDELVREWLSALPVRTAQLNCWSNFESSADLTDYASGNTWTAVGTVSSGYSPALSLLSKQPSVIRRIGSVPLVDTGGGSPDVTVAITGVAGTGAAGSVTPSTDVPTTGVAGTSAAGTGAPSTTVPSTGVAGTSAVGSVTETHPGTVAATGVSATGAAGTVTPGTDVAPTGVAGTGAAGTVSPGAAPALTGVAGTGSVGTVAPSTTVGVTGVAGTGAVGTVSASSPGTAAITGVAATGAVGTVTPSTTLAVTGAAGTTAAGTVGPSTAVALTGASATGAAGTVGVAVTVGLTGVAGTTAVGAVVGTVAGANVTVAVSGVTGTGAVGSVTVSGGDVAVTYTRRNVSTILAWLDTRLAAATGISSSSGALRTGGHRFTLEREPLPQMDGDAFADVEALAPFLRNRIVGEAYWEATVVVRVAYYRGGGDAGGGDRQSVMRDGLGDAMRLADACELPSAYDSSNTGVSRVTYMGAHRAATFKRGEIWETRLLVRWRSDSYAS